ncbi:MAG: hypothetical protein CXT73_04235 [Methanobacteriota archaeon]|nr:MAG: hypothetical protein CXT73_04235 [Euryarchaeota archaeon]
MASNSKKVISINPDFFKFSKKTSKKKREKRDSDVLSSSVNKGLKKNLLNKLIEKFKKEELIGTDSSNVNEELEKSIDYLNTIVKKRKEKQEKRKNHAKTMKKRPVIENTPIINIQPPTLINNIQPRLTDNQPKYGCLKNGNLPTFKQYNKTIKNRNDLMMCLCIKKRSMKDGKT